MRPTTPLKHASPSRTSKASGFRGPSNLKRPNSLLFSAKLHHECEITATLESYAYFSVPNGIGEQTNSRRCLLSMLLKFVPGRGASIGKFSISFDIARGLDDPPSVEGFKFLSLEETIFVDDFAKAVYTGKSHLGPVWHQRGYEDIFCGPSDMPYIAGRLQTYIWGERRMHPTLTIRGDGFEGGPACAVQTIPLCILLSFSNPIPPVLLANISLKARIAPTTDNVLVKPVRSSVVSYHHMRDLRLCNGPEAPVCDGDFTYFQSSLVTDFSQVKPRRTLRSSLAASDTLRNLFRAKKVDFLDVSVNDLPGRNKISKAPETASVTPETRSKSRKLKVANKTEDVAPFNTVNTADCLPSDAMGQSASGSGHMAATALQSRDTADDVEEAIEPITIPATHRMPQEASIRTNVPRIAPAPSICHQSVKSECSSTIELYQGSRQRSTKRPHSAAHGQDNYNGSSKPALTADEVNMCETEREHAHRHQTTRTPSVFKRKPTPANSAPTILPSLVPDVFMPSRTLSDSVPSSRLKGPPVQPLPDRIPLHEITTSRHRTRASRRAVVHVERLQIPDEIEIEALMTPKPGNTAFPRQLEQQGSTRQPSSPSFSDLRYKDQLSHSEAPLSGAKSPSAATRARAMSHPDYRRPVLGSAGPSGHATRWRKPSSRDNLSIITSEQASSEQRALSDSSWSLQFEGRMEFASV